MQNYESNYYPPITNNFDIVHYEKINYKTSITTNSTRSEERRVGKECS